MIRIHDRLRDEGRAARLVLQVHDELLLEVPDAEVKDDTGARPRRDVRRVRSRSAARGRRRRGGELGRGEELTHHHLVTRIVGCGTGCSHGRAILPDRFGEQRSHGARARRLGHRTRRRAHPRLRVDLPRDQRGRGGARHRRAGRQGRGSRRHRLQVGGRHPGRRALDPPLGQPGRRGLASATRSMRSSSRRRTPKAG